MTKQIYRMKSFWCILAALLLVALCVVAWMVGTARATATAGSPATIVAVNDTIYAPGDATGNTQFSFNTVNGVSTLTLTDFSLTTFNKLPNNWGGGPKGNPLYDNVCREWSFIWADGDLTIEVNGENHLDNTGLDFSYDGTTGLATRGIYVDGDLTIKGTNINDSVLYVDGDKNASYECTGIYATGKITIQNCTIVAETEYSGNDGSSFGICAGTSMEITNADVTANPGAPQGTGGCHGIYAMDGQLTIDNSTVNATAADTSSWGVGIRTLKGDAIICNNSQVTATSAKGYYSAGIHIEGQLQILSSTVKSDSGEATVENSRGICAVHSGNDALIIRNSKVEATGGQTDGNHHSCGIWAKGNMIVSSDESLSLNASDMVKAVGGKTIGAGNSYGIYTQSGTLTVTCNSAVSEGYYHINAVAGEAKGAGESAGIHCQATDVKGNAIVNATGGNSSSGTSVGIYADFYVEVHDTSEVTAKGGTANSSYGIQTAAGFYVRTYDYATLTAMGGVATSDFSTGIRTSGVLMYGGTIKAYGGIDRLDDQGKCVITTPSANACGIHLIPTGDLMSRDLEIKDGNLHALGAETVTSGGQSYGIWREGDDYTGPTSTGVDDTDLCNFRVHAGVVRADGATQAILMPANAALSGTPDTYVVCISTIYGGKKAETAIVRFEDYTFDSSHKRVDIEPHDYCNFPVPYLDAGGEKKICYNARFFRGNGTIFNAQQERWYVANISWTTDENGDPKITDALDVLGNVHLILQDGVTVRCEQRGIHVTGDDKLTIYSQSLGDQMGKLYAENAMEVQAVGCGAGIGGYVSQAGEDPMPEKSGTITINGGEIHATGSAGSAGIGGCFNGEAGEIVINNGKIIANGGHFAAGIGSGDAGYATKITINGGYVKSTGHGRAAGIGGGGAGKAASQCPGGGIININGGYVEAYGGTGYNNGIYWNFEYLSMQLMAKIHKISETEAKAQYGTHSYDPTNPKANKKGYVEVEKGKGDFAYNEDYQLRRIPSAIGDGMGSTDTIALRNDGSGQSTASQVSIKNAVVVVNHQHKKNILEDDYWSLSEDVLFIENFTNPYDFAVDWNHAQTTDSQAYWVAKDENGKWKNSDESWAKELGQVTCPADSAYYANYQAILKTTTDGRFDLRQDVTLPADMTVTLTVQENQQFNANGHTFGVKTVLVQDRNMSIPVFTNNGNVSVGNTYYEIVYTAIDPKDKDVISITDKDGADGAIRNSHTYEPQEPQDSDNKIEKYAKDLEMTDLRYYGEPTKTIRVDPKPGTYVWKYVTSPNNLGFAAIKQTLAHQFTMPATIVYLVKPAAGEIQKVQFSGDRGAVTEGKVYTSGSIGNNGSVNILANGSFTAHFSGLSYFYQGVTFEFTPALPDGTKLVLMDRSGSAVNQGMVYAYTTRQNDINVATNTTSIPASSFVRMTRGDHLTLDDVRLKEAIAFRLSVELPDDPAKDAPERNYTVYMKDGNTKIGNVIVQAAADYAGKVDSFVYDPAPGTISGQVIISGIKGSNNVLVVQLKDENEAVIPLPLGAQITLDGVLPTSYGENGVIFAGIDPGETPENSQISKTLTITHLPADKYYLCMAVCEAPQNSSYPMSQAGAWWPANQLDTPYEVDAVVPEAIQITAEDRVMDRDANETTLTLTVEGSTSVNLSSVTAVLQRQTDTTGNFAIVTDNSVTLTSSADKKTHTVTAYFSTQTVPAGLYRIVFTLDGGTVQYFYFIIT